MTVIHASIFFFHLQLCDMWCQHLPIRLHWTPYGMISSIHTITNNIYDVWYRRLKGKKINFLIQSQMVYRFLHLPRILQLCNYDYTVKYICYCCVQMSYLLSRIHPQCYNALSKYCPEATSCAYVIVWCAKGFVVQYRWHLPDCIFA